MDGVLLSYRRKPRNRLSLPVSPPPAPTASSSIYRSVNQLKVRVVEACGVDGERRASGRNPAKELHRGPRSFGVALFQVACNLSISIYCNLSVSASTAPVRAARIQMGFLGPVRAGVVEVIALNSSQAAEGELYIDDGRSFDFKEGAYIHRRFIFSAGTLTSLNLTPSSGSEILPERKPEKSPYEVLRQSKASVVSKMLSLKKEGKQKSELRELATQIFLNFQKKTLQGIIANRKKFLLSLPSHLKSLKKASLPVQNQLGVQHTKKLKQLHSAELLPPPLYVIYSQLLAQKEAFEENIEMEINGSVKDAQAVARLKTLLKLPV
nr:tho complex subunit 5B [Ipomoea batatas]GME10993.1 tho complex subunit 5B [Ipomoea batatas]